MEAALTSKGQITIPKAVRQHLRVKPGDRVKIFIHPDGTVVLLPKVPVTVLRGILKWNGPPATLEQMDAAIAEGAAAGTLKRPKGR
jgi:AbrB family looped-hinge helix DNA binding protein